MSERRRAAEGICDTLRNAGYRALLAGGCVRDMLLGVEPQDYDIATSARPREVARLFEHTVGVGAAFGVQMVLLPEGPFEVATFRQDGPYLDGRHPSRVEFAGEKVDAQRRDFTINGMFYEPLSGEVVDYVGGRDDMAREVIRAIGTPHDRFSEDHLRLLRAVRFAARLGYRLDEDTEKAIAELAPQILTTSWERIRDEILKCLTEGAARRAFELLDRTGLLEQVLPEVAAMKGVEQPPKFHPEGDVWEHVLLMLELMDSPTPTLALGVLLHDVGKPPTQSFEDRIRFNNHDKAGAHIAAAICRRLRMPAREREHVVWMVKNHMRVAATPDMRPSKLKRFVREAGFPELLELCRLDCLGSHNKTDTVDWLTDYIGNLQPEETRPEPLVRGDDLIAMGYTPGPLFGEILGTVEDEQLEGNLTTREGAEAFIREHWPPPGVDGG